MNQPVHVIQATPAHYQAVYDLLEQARRWLIQEKHITRQWPTAVPRAILMSRIEQNLVYIAIANGKVVGTITILWDDPDAWGPQSPVAGYAHSLAVERSWAGQGLGLYLLNEAARIVARAGRQYLRLDCWAANAVLCQYYEQAGFESRGYHTWAAIPERGLDEFTVHRYEKPVPVDAT
jgi:GNAT superfamily N-acetyltransferase